MSTSLALVSVAVEALLLLYLFLDVVVRAGRLRRFLWKLGLWLLLMLPGVAMLNFDFTSQVQVDVSMAIMLSTFVSGTIWVVVFDPDISRTVTLVQLGTLVGSCAVTALTILSGGRGGGGEDEGTWRDKGAFLLRVPGIVGAFFVRLPWDGPRIVRGLCWTLIWFWVARTDADEYYPPDKLQWLNRTLEVNGTVLLLDRIRRVVE
ncbi:Bromodomain protein [Cordyceps militaris]|uniref:Bromodomain protein n=1 Tax=Cordyceps militaris TaxID=73501 RepID=A0A2H4S5W2_CORMI|nr:Bromodomain protein [Cordyceps militaris]